MSICLAITDADLELTKDMLGLLFSGLAAFGAIIAAGAAVLGVSTWRKQLRGQADYQLAEEMLIAVYKYQELLQVSWGVAGHAIHKIDSEEWMGLEDNGLPESYFSHWLGEMKKGRSEFDLVATKCAALWSGQFKDGFKWLHYFAYYCSEAINSCIALHDGSGYTPEKEDQAALASAKWLSLTRRVHATDADPSSYLTRLLLPIVAVLDDKRNVRS